MDLALALGHRALSSDFVPVSTLAPWESKHPTERTKDLDLAHVLRAAAAKDEPDDQDMRLLRVLAVVAARRIEELSATKPNGGTT